MPEVNEREYPQEKKSSKAALYVLRTPLSASYGGTEGNTSVISFTEYSTLRAPENTDENRQCGVAAIRLLK